MKGDGPNYITKLVPVHARAQPTIHTSANTTVSPSATLICVLDLALRHTKTYARASAAPATVSHTLREG